VGPTAADSVDRDGFDEFFRFAEPVLRGAFVALYGADVGRDAAAEALAKAWQDWERVRPMENRMGYLFRVGQSRSRKLRRALPSFPPAVPSPDLPWVEPRLPEALRGLTDQQRVAVVLAHGYGLTHVEIADLMGIARSSVQNHVERGLRKLRAAMEASP